MGNLEKDVISGVKERLKIWEFHKIVLWADRLNSGRVKTEYGTWVQMCQKGTPDYLAIIRNKDNGLSMLWFECKSDTGRLRPEQEIFRNRFKSVKDVHYYVIDNPKMVDIIISDLGINRLNELPDNL